MSTLLKILSNKPLSQDEKEIVGAVTFRHGKIIEPMFENKLAELYVENMILRNKIKKQNDKYFFYSLLSR